MAEQADHIEHRFGNNQPIHIAPSDTPLTHESAVPMDIDSELNMTSNGCETVTQVIRFNQEQFCGTGGPSGYMVEPSHSHDTRGVFTLPSTSTSHGVSGFSSQVLGNTDDGSQERSERGEMRRVESSSSSDEKNDKDKENKENENEKEEREDPWAAEGNDEERLLRDDHSQSMKEWAMEAVLSSQVQEMRPTAGNLERGVVMIEEDIIPRKPSGDRNQEQESVSHPLENQLARPGSQVTGFANTPWSAPPRVTSSVYDNTQASLNPEAIQMNNNLGFIAVDETRRLTPVQCARSGCSPDDSLKRNAVIDLCQENDEAILAVPLTRPVLDQETIKKASGYEDNSKRFRLNTWHSNSRGAQVSNKTTAKAGHCLNPDAAIVISDEEDELNVPIQRQMVKKEVAVKHKVMETPRIPGWEISLPAKLVRMKPLGNYDEDDESSLLEMPPWIRETRVDSMEDEEKVEEQGGHDVDRLVKSEPVSKDEPVIIDDGSGNNEDDDVIILEVIKRERKEAQANSGDLELRFAEESSSLSSAQLLKNIEHDSKQQVRMSVPLLKHQVVAVKWMIDRERHGSPNGGILADDQGLGKTITALAVTIANRPGGGQSWRTLIIAPASVLSQWKAEIESKVFCKMKPYIIVYHGQQKAGIKADDLRKADFVITTFGTVGTEFKAAGPTGQSLLAQVRWYRVILDEAQNIKNRRTNYAKSCVQLKARHRWCLSGTPLQNHVDDIYSLLIFLRFNIPQVENYADWKMLYQADLGSNNPDRLNACYERLRNVVAPISLRRTKASVDPETGKPILQLPERQVSTVTLEFGEQERKFYDTLLNAKEYKMVLKYGEAYIKANFSHVLVLLLNLRQACCHVQLVVDRYRDLSDSERDQILGSLERGRALMDRMYDFRAATCKSFLSKYGAALVESVAEMVVCSICKETMLHDTADIQRDSQPKVTVCGHMFCSPCLAEHLLVSKQCYMCSSHLKKAKIDVMNLLEIRKELVVLLGRRRHEAADLWLKSRKMNADQLLAEGAAFRENQATHANQAAVAAGTPAPFSDTPVKNELARNAHGSGTFHPSPNVALSGLAFGQPAAMNPIVPGHGVMKKEPFVVGMTGRHMTSPEAMTVKADPSNEYSPDWPAMKPAFDVQTNGYLPQGLGSNRFWSSPAAAAVKSEPLVFGAAQNALVSSGEWAQDGFPAPSGHVKTEPFVIQGALNGASATFGSPKAEPVRVVGCEDGPKHSTDFAEMLAGYSSPDRMDGPSNVPAKQASQEEVLDLRDASSSKIYALVKEILKMRKEDRDLKCLVFSQWTSMLNLIKAELDKEGVEFCEVVGCMTIKQRDDEIQKFRESAINVMLLSLRAASTGLNLICASRVFIMDMFWNPAVEHQAIDRVHRIGQTRPVQVIRFKVKDTVEDEILRLQQRKEGMMHGVMSLAGTISLDETSTGAGLTVRDIMNIFKNAGGKKLSTGIHGHHG